MATETASAELEVATAVPRPATATRRVDSIDVVRGAIIVLMVLDHTRDYFHAYSQHFDPVDLSHSSLAIFLTRWITHFCAPGFVFLAGVSIRLMSRRKLPQEITRYLLIRGSILVGLEMTVVRFGWDFTLRPYFYAQIIWTLGWCMIAMAPVVRLRKRLIVLLAILIAVLVWSPFDYVFTSKAPVLWAVLWSGGRIAFGHFFVVAGYPILRWLPVMIIGYWAGALFFPERQNRVRTFAISGFICTLMFLLVRSFGWLDGQSFIQSSPRMQIASFLNCTKIPVSIPYLLMTLGPLLIALSIVEKLQMKPSFLLNLGRTPLFFYVLHLYVIHCLAIAVTVMRGQPIQWALPFTVWFPSPRDSGFGFGTPEVYLFAAIVVLLLYPACIVYGKAKKRSRYNILHFL
jgi:uncharacterized membrane protein